MKKLGIGLSILILGLIAFWVCITIPTPYDVAPFEEREGTQYWNLGEGSRIGYFKIKGSLPSKESPIIFLHGGPGGWVKDKHIKALQDLGDLGYDLYFYDQIGSGHSTRLEDISAYSVQRHREDLRDLIAQIGASQVILLGHSWGACLAISYLQEYPESVEKIILAGPGPILPINKAMAKLLPPDSLNLKAAEFSNKSGNEEAYNWKSRLMYRNAIMFHSKLLEDAEADQFFAHLMQLVNRSTTCQWKEAEESTAAVVGGGYYSHVMTVKRLNEVSNKRDLLQTLETPILLLRGQCDNQAWGYAKEYLDIFQNAELKIMEGVGHDLLQNEAEYRTQIQTFIAP